MTAKGAKGAKDANGQRQGRVALLGQRERRTTMSENGQMTSRGSSDSDTFLLRVLELVVLVVIGTSIWVAFDAPTHGLSWTWGLGSLALWIVVFPWYLVERRKSPKVPQRGLHPPASAPETDLQRLQRMRADGQLNAAQYEAEKRQLAKRQRQ
jgi:hypothetical protein